MQAQIIPGTEGLPPVLQLVAVLAFAIVMGGGAALTQIRGRKDAERRAEQEKKQATTTAGSIMAMQPTADRYTQDALVTTLAGIQQVLTRINERMDAQDRDQEEEERAELRELRRIVKDIRAKE